MTYREYLVKFGFAKPADKAPSKPEGPKPEGKGKAPAKK